MAKKNSVIGLDEEALLWKEGRAFVFGIDEAGRGCLAGPVCAGVSCWQQNFSRTENDGLEITDSKQISEKNRELLFPIIQESALAYGVGFASSQEIDQWNILRATSLAVARAAEQALAMLVNQGLLQIGQIRGSAFAFLSDGSHPLLLRARNFVYSAEYGVEFPLLREFMVESFLDKPIVKGDSKVFSIAAASILAKVSRDRLMHSLHERYPAYDFLIHKGYSTAKHIEKLRENGPCSEHRFSFTPVSEAVKLID